MEDNMMPQTRESERQLNEWIEQTRDNENAVLMNAENLLETLTDWRTVMTPGFCVCRALQTHYPEILEGLDCPDLKQLDHSRGMVGSGPPSSCPAAGRSAEYWPSA